MKTNRFFALAAFVALALVACKKSEPTPTPDPEPEFTASLKVDKTDKISAEAAGKTETLKVTANVSWTATSDQSWATVAPASESITDKKSKETSTTITVAENTGTDVRTATITFKAEGVSDVKISIEQAGVALPDPVFSVLDGDLNPLAAEIPTGSSEGSVSAIVYSNISWTAASDADWLTVTPESAEIKDYEETPTAVTINWSANIGAERSATLTFSAEGVDPVAVTVNQAAAPTLEISVANITYQTADVTLTPSVDNAKYYQVLTAYTTFEQLQSKGYDAAGVVKYFLTQSANLNEMTDAEFFSYVYSQGSRTINYTGLPENTNLIAIACYLNDEAETISVGYTAEFTTAEKPSVDPDYTALLGTYTFTALDYFASDLEATPQDLVFVDGTFVVEEGVVNETYKISIPGIDWCPESGQYIDRFECPWDKTGKKSFSLIQGTIGDEGEWNYGNLGYCDISLDIFFWTADTAIDAVVLTADANGNLSATAPAVPDEDYLCLQSGIVNAAGSTGYANGLLVFTNGMNFTKQAVSTVKNAVQHSVFELPRMLKNKQFNANKVSDKLSIR